MTTKGFVVLAFMVIAAGLFGFVGFHVGTTDKFDLVSLGLFSQALAILVHWFMPGPEIT